MKTVEETLKPCPFCGGEAFRRDRVVEGHKVYRIYCKMCGVMMVSPVPDYVAELWNRRKQEDDY